jgi:hypothetical protein
VPPKFREKKFDRHPKHQNQIDREKCRKFTKKWSTRPANPSRMQISYPNQIRIPTEQIQEIPFSHSETRYADPATGTRGRRRCGGVSQREADLFFADLIGRPALRPAIPRAPAPRAPDAAAVLGHLLPDGPPLYSEEQSRPTTTDSAVSDNLALLVVDQAPLPVSQAESQRTATDRAAQDDYRSVCAVVPDNPENRLLLFFHGNNNYVTIAARGDVEARVDATGHSRLPRWLSSDQRASAAGTPAAALKYGLHWLSSAQRRFSPEGPLGARPVRDPIVLAPQVAERTVGRFWAVPPRGQYGRDGEGTPTGPGSRRLQDLIDECLQRLQQLGGPQGRRYLTAGNGGTSTADLGRLYLAGHSGGGKPLVEAAGADIALPTPTSVMSAVQRGVDVWLLDCTYRGFGARNYLAFCRRWHQQRRLAHRPDGARLVCVYRPQSPGSDTETAADELRAALARELGWPAGELRKLHDSADLAAPSMIRDVIPALTSSPVVFIRTRVAHDQIPTLFVPLLLRTSAA